MDQPLAGGLPGLLARNTLMNLLTQALLMIIAFWGINALASDLGESHFGLLTVVWTFVGYFGLLDFGISRAVTKFVADGLVDAKESDPRSMVWSSLTLATGFGAVAALALILSTRFWTGTVFSVPPELAEEAGRAFVLAAVGVPFMLAYGVLRGIQMACQRFGTVNGIQLMIGGVQWIGAVIVVRAGGGLDAILAITIAVRVLAAAASFLLLPTMLKGIFRDIRVIEMTVVRKLMVFGGWVTVSQAVSPLFSYLDRILVGTLAGLSAVAFYSVPQEALLRILVVPLSLTNTLFPAMSQYGRFPQDRETSSQLYYRSARYLFVVVLPLCVVLFSLSDVILELWVGVRYAEESSLAFRILVLGLFASSVAQIPAAALPAFGRPDLPAKFHLLELPVMIVLNLALIPLLGIAGAAATWTLRVLIDAVLLFGGVVRTRREEARTAGRLLLWRGLLIQAMWGGAMGLVVTMVTQVPLRIEMAAVFLVGHLILVWNGGLDRTDKTLLATVSRTILRPRV